MSPDEKLQGLLRLKRHESPPPGFFDHLLDDLHHRQRKELMNRGSLSILWERICTWLDSLKRPAVIWTMGGAYATLLLLVCFWPKSARNAADHPVVITVTVPPPASHNVTPPPPPNRAVPVNHGLLVPSGIKQKSVDPGPEQPTGPVTKDPPEL